LAGRYPCCALDGQPDADWQVGPSAAVPESCWVRAIVFAVGGLVDVAEVVDGRQGQDFVHLGKDVGHTVAHVWDSIF
jgi:hypothetical protein